MFETLFHFLGQALRNVCAAKDNCHPKHVSTSVDEQIYVSLQKDGGVEGSFYCQLGLVLEIDRLEVQLCFNYPFKNFYLRCACNFDLWGYNFL